ncbi:MAG TPA: hypothetical protein PKN52_00235, partial [Trueperaceae bacterium]|nr:hypothetical protein [Trueperaceae bacterium]
HPGADRKPLPQGAGGHVHAGGAVQLHERGPAGGARVGVGGEHGDGLLEREDVAKLGIVPQGVEEALEAFVKTAGGFKRFELALEQLREPGALDLASGSVLVRILEQARTAANAGVAKRAGAVDPRPYGP